MIAQNIPCLRGNHQPDATRRLILDLRAFTFLRLFSSGESPMSVRAVLVLCVPVLIAGACAPELRITTSKNVASEPVVACIPAGGSRPAPIDTTCSEGSPRCYKIRPMGGSMQSPDDDFGVTVAAGMGEEGTEVLCFTSTR